MLGYIWPKNNPSVRARVVLSLLLLVGAKVLNIQVTPMRICCYCCAQREHADFLVNQFV